MSSANLANFQKKLKRAHAANMTQNVNNSVDEMLPESQEQQGFEGAFLPSRLNLKLRYYSSFWDFLIDQFNYLNLFSNISECIQTFV